MSVEITAAGKIVGGHVMVQTLLPRVVDGNLIKLSFDGNDEFPERIMATTPTGQFAGHLNKALALVIHKSRERVIAMKAICKETSSRRTERWAVDVSYTLSPV